MLKNINPSNTKAWADLEKHFLNMKDVHISSLFQEDSNRFEQFSVTFKDILLDYSKNRITSETISLLLNLAKEVELDGAIEDIFSALIISA